MFYQKLLTGQNPYFATIANTTAFPMHRHPDVELSFCLHGKYSIQIDGKKHTLQPGDLAVIKPTSAHEYFEPEIQDTLNLTLVIGPGFLGEYFTPFATREFNVIYHLKDSENPGYITLYNLLMETATLCDTQPDFSALQIKGNLYQISASILKYLPIHADEKAMPKKLQDISKIEKSLEIIHQEYAHPLSIDAVSRACGYSKSNFCKIFKSITGDTFHNVLNKQRVEIACLHLRDDTLSIEAIAESVGFADAKSFCRVFKKITNTSPGAYRKTIR